MTESKIAQRLHEPLPGLVVCYLSPIVGYGLCTQKAIPQNTVIGFFSGEVGRLVPDDSYTYSMDMFFPHTETDTSTIIGISARSSGGLSRFMQHLPIDLERKQQELVQGLPAALAAKMGIPINKVEALMEAKDIDLNEFVAEITTQSPAGAAGEQELQSLNFSNPACKESLQTSNVRIVPHLFKGRYPLLVVVADRDIPANSQLGYSYGLQKYWVASHRKPCYFNQNAAVISPAQYQFKLTEAEQMIYHKARANYQQGIQQYRSESHQKAIEMFTAAITIFGTTKSRYCSENVSAYSSLASAYRDSDEPNKAIDACLDAIQIAQFIERSDLLPKLQTKLVTCLQHKDVDASLLYKRCVLLFKDKNYEIALQGFKACHNIFTAQDALSVNVAKCLYSIGSCYNRLGEVSSAIRQYEEAIKVYATMPSEFKPRIDQIQKKIDQLRLEQEKQRLRCKA